ncbi:hypothetical protein QJQ45_010256 [Haematococcus lacustris]|nr:hypothetical protein QJQ45_010256 [Haematococcus lacustris]
MTTEKVLGALNWTTEELTKRASETIPEAEDAKKAKLESAEEIIRPSRSQASKASSDAAQAATDHLSAAGQEVKEAVAATTESVSQGAEAAKDTASEKADEAAGSVQDLVDKAKENIKETVDSMKETFHENVDAARDKVAGTEPDVSKPATEPASIEEPAKAVPADLSAKTEEAIVDGVDRQSQGGSGQQGVKQPGNGECSSLPLPDAIVVSIFSRLDTRDLARAQAVCKQFRTLGALDAWANKQWRQRYTQRWQVSGKLCSTLGGRQHTA